MYAHNETFARFIAYYGSYVFWGAVGVFAAGFWLVQ
jgi:hypothetical protein